ncbi:unnamed protein product [Caenorhabditis sp. 36 PRJEB53466]|nr:unnamed protein product [Caenorhabditis sp. 36 PRJEB53466]
MSPTVKSCLLIIATNIIIAIYFLSTCRKRINLYENVAPTVLQIREKQEIDNTFPIVFYNNAFIDHRYNPPRLRVFSMNPCVAPKEFIVVELDGKGTRVRLRGEPTEGECPWHWATQCLYNSYIWTAQLPDGDVEKITIHLGNHTVTIRVQNVSVKEKHGFTVCVQPVYWYSEFHNIALFIESWRAQGATRFIVYFHSSTKEVRRLLEYYRNLGILDLKPWPSLGSPSPSATSHFPFPSFDSSTYRVGHTLAQNLCVLEMRTELGAIADFDEVMVPQEGILTDYAQKTMEPGVIGALSFPHLLVKFEPKISSMDYFGVLNPVFVDRNGPPKVAFNSSSVDVIGTHSVRKFIGSESTVTASGSLLHYRHNSNTEVAKEVRSTMELFPDSGVFYVRKIRNTLRTVFGDSIPVYNSTFLHVLNECISKIVGEGKCRSTVTYCSQWMESLTEWEREETKHVFAV